MSQPVLSVLIPSIPERFGMATQTYLNVQRIFSRYDVEIILLMDNKKISIGEKRNRLKNMAHGKYFCFCDDDDYYLFGAWKIAEAASASNNPDVITFKQCVTNNGIDYVIDFDLNNKNDGTLREGEETKRMPFHVCAWKTDKFRECNFADVNYGEDMFFVAQAILIAKTQYKINEVLHWYTYSDNISQSTPGGIKR